MIEWKMIPPFRSDGYLPEGLFLAKEPELTFRFGSGSPRRARLVLRASCWIKLSRAVRARRSMIDGSFITAKQDPNDVDAVILLPNNFHQLVDQGLESALELDQMLLTRQPEEIFAAEDERDWMEWIEFFSRTRETDNRRKGLVELQL